MFLNFGAGEPGVAARATRESDKKRKYKSETDILVEVANRLGKIRELAGKSRDESLLYFLDMTMFHICELIRSASRQSPIRHSQEIESH